MNYFVSIRLVTKFYIYAYAKSVIVRKYAITLLIAKGYRHVSEKYGFRISIKRENIFFLISQW